MKLFGRRVRFPHDMLDRLERLGRFEINHLGSGISIEGLYERCIQPFRADAESDPEGFAAALRTLVADDVGGFATYGASRLLAEVAWKFRSPDALAILDAAVALKRTFGFPTAMLVGDEWDRWKEQHTPESWWDLGGGSGAGVGEGSPVPGVGERPGTLPGR